jgi:hypothetical protein
LDQPERPQHTAERPAQPLGSQIRDGPIRIALILVGDRPFDERSAAVTLVLPLGFDQYPHELGLVVSERLAKTGESAEVALGISMADVLIDRVTD